MIAKAEQFCKQPPYQTREEQADYFVIAPLNPES
jgi:hypothetical protein